MLNKDVCRIIALKLGGKDALNFFSTCKTLNRNENYAYYLRHKYKVQNIKTEENIKEKLVYIVYREEMLKNIFKVEYKHDIPFVLFCENTLNAKCDFWDNFHIVSNLIQNEKIKELTFLINTGVVSTFLHLKEISKRTKVIKLFVEKEKDSHDKYNKLLVYACRYGNIEGVKYLLDHGFDINMDNERPLMEAMKRGRRDLAVYLIKHGAKLENISDYELAADCKILDYITVKNHFLSFKELILVILNFIFILTYSFYIK